MAEQGIKINSIIDVYSTKTKEFTSLYAPPGIVTIYEANNIEKEWNISRKRKLDSISPSLGLQIATLLSNKKEFRSKQSVYEEYMKEFDMLSTRDIIRQLVSHYGTKQICSCHSINLFPIEFKHPITGVVKTLHRTLPNIYIVMKMIKEKIPLCSGNEFNIKGLV